jgi:hypothetical protein
MTHQIHCGIEKPSSSLVIESAYSPEKKTMTAVVATYSIVSARPVMKPPHGPIAARENEYAPPVCGIADAISPIEKMRP